VRLPVRYKGTLLKANYRADFVCFDGIIVEVKAQERIAGADEAQVLNYLKATGFKRALILNFGAPRLQHKRLVLTPIRVGPAS
jgi:GxxExxY protein